MSDLLLIPICIAAGIALRKIRVFSGDAYKFINSIIIYINLPALTLYYIPQISFNFTLFYPAVMIWIMYLSAVLFFMLAEKIFRWDKRTTGALILTGGLANTSFVGFPVLIALFGEEGLKIGVIIDQAGSFLVLSTLGVITASLYSSGKYSGKKIISDIIKYPPFIAFIISAVMVISGIKHNGITLNILNKLGAPTIVLALISVGMQLKLNINELLWKELFTGLLFKLIIIPAAIFILFYYAIGLRGLVFQVSLIEAAMPPMVMGSVLASQFELNPKLANLMVGIGIPLSALTLIFWYYLL